MAETRPSGYPVFGDPSASVAEEVTEIDGRGRIRFLPRWTNRIPWWKSTSSEGFDVLMVFVEPGLISFRDWISDGEQVAARFAQIAAEDDDDALEALRLIQDRYQKLPIDKERRAHLGDPALAHLGLPIQRGSRSTVYVAVYPSRLDIFSVAYRNEKLVIGSPLLDDLP
jgi:hypothetical protein